MSVSLPAEEVEFLDEYAEEFGLSSRSAAVLKAVRLLRESKLSREYAAAFDEWDASGEAELWEPVTGDGLSS